MKEAAERLNSLDDPWARTIEQVVGNAMEPTVPDR
jgi:hypothetical protein